MTVKDLKEVLNGCNDDAIVYLKGTDIGTIGLVDSDIFQLQLPAESKEVCGTYVVIVVPPMTEGLFDD